MKKILLTATMLVGFAAISQAQQGRVGVNTTTPAATLDVVANTTDNTRPDALLVPRMTRAQLILKDGAYGNTGTGATNQNGALVFVTTIDGTVTTKTANVTAIGFYYYDGPAAVWRAMGGGAAGPDVSLYSQDGTLAGPRVVTQNNNNLTFTTGTGRTIINGTQQNNGAQYVKYRKVTAGPITWAADDYGIILEFGSTFSGNLTLPDATTNVGRMIYIGNSSGSTATFGATNTATTPRVGSTITSATGFTYVSDGTTWYILSGR